MSLVLSHHQMQDRPPVRITTSGVIRSGIMVPTGTAAQKPGLMERYNAGVKAGASWDAIDRTLRKEFSLDRSPLRPKNAPYFTARSSDFSSPEIARKIFELYAEDLGEGPHLYTLPVIFPSDNLLTVLPHSLKCFTSGGLKYWSEHDADGVRRCKMYAPIEMGPGGKLRRPFGGRARVDRDWNDGICDPENCPEYQATPQACKMTGALVFYIPDIPGSAIELRTSSYYGMANMVSQLSEMMEMRGGISGTFNGEPLFRLTKREESVSMIDMETGKPKRVKQFVPVVEKTIDVSALFATAEHRRALPSAAAAMLEGPTTETDPF